MSMNTDRELIGMALAKRSLKQIAASLEMKPASVQKIAKRLGIYLQPLNLKAAKVK